MVGFLTSWGTVVWAYVASSLSVFTGQVHPVSLIATAGLISLIAGVGLAIGWRERQVLWLLPLVVLASLTPFILGVANSILDWMGVGFAVLGGTLVLLIGVAMVANDATRRLPVWLIGVFIFIFAPMCWLAAGALAMPA